MPIKVNMYACDFRCGLVRSKRSTIKKHEPSCSSNPSKKGCSTCKYFSKFLDSNGMDGAYKHEWLVSSCQVSNLAEPTSTNPSGLKFNCQEWAAK